MHFLIPLLILLALYPKIDKRLAIGLALLTFVPDLDFFISFTHRFLFHSIFFPIILSLIIYFFTKNLKIFWISFYYLASHTILDLTMGMVAVFWPIYQKLIEINISLNTWWQFEFSIKTYPLTRIQEHMTTSPANFFTETGIAVILVLVVMLIIKYRKKLFKK